MLNLKKAVLLSRVNPKQIMSSTKETEPSSMVKGARRSMLLVSNTLIFICRSPI